MISYFKYLLLVLALISVANPIYASETTQLNWADIAQLTPLQRLGKEIFFDTNLSSPAGQGCVSCHDPKVAFSDPNLEMPVSDGAVDGRTGTRNSPAIMYAAFSPFFHFDDEESLYIGGAFLDGRVNNIKEQAKQPFLNTDEMNNADTAEVVVKIRQSSYAELFKQVYGAAALDNADLAFDYTADALAAFENSFVFNSFTSKYDYYLAGKLDLTDLEKQGLELFNDEQKGNCAACHPSTSDTSVPPLFTDYSYDNLGVPVNSEIVNRKGADFVDLGLGVTVNDAARDGKFKVPSLRNIAKTAPYMHNGVFKSLREVVEFYNTRDVDSKWGEPEVAANENVDELGDLKLTAGEVDAITAFLKTLTDGYTANPPTYTSNSQQLDLPEVKITSPITHANSVVSAQLKKDSNSPYYRLISWQENQNPSASNSFYTPWYSFETNVLEIPLLVVDGRIEYIAQLKRVPNETDYLFELIYSKALMD